MFGGISMGVRSFPLWKDANQVSPLETFIPWFYWKTPKGGAMTTLQVIYYNEAGIFWMCRPFVSVCVCQLGKSCSTCIWWSWRTPSVMSGQRSLLSIRRHGYHDTAAAFLAPSHLTPCSISRCWYQDTASASLDYFPDNTLPTESYLQNPCHHELKNPQTLQSLI